MICVFSVLIVWAKLPFKRGLFCLVGIVIIATEQLQLAIQNFPFHYTATQITLEDFGCVFRRGNNLHWCAFPLMHIAMATLLLMLELLCAQLEV